MAIANGYATLNQVKAALRITDATDDALIEMATESASRLIDAYCGRNFISAGTAATTRYYSTENPYVVNIDDARSISVVQTSTSADGTFDTTWTVGTPGSDVDAQPEPLNDYIGGITWPYTRIRAVGDYAFPVGPEAVVKVTAVYGWPSIPTVVTQAAVIQASRLFARLQSPLGVAGFGDMGIMRVSSKLDPDVAQLIEGYRRVTGVA